MFHILVQKQGVKKIMSIEVRTIETAPEGSKETLNQVKSAFGFVPNLMGVFSNSPETLKAYLSVSELFEATSFSPTEQQIVLLTASYENTCDYCVAAHTVISGMQKISDDVVNAIRNGEKLEDEKLEALRQFTAEVTRKRGKPSQESKDRFHGAGYTAQNGLEVILGVTQKTLSNYVNHIAKTPLDDNFASAKWEKSQAESKTA